MKRVVVDSNIVLSGLFFDKNPEKLLQLGIDGRVTIILPNFIIGEINEKVTTTFSNNARLGDAKPFLEVILRAFSEKPSDLLEEKETFVECRDKDDEKWLSYCTRIKPDYVISGDDDVLSTKAPFEIIKLTDFLKKEFKDEA